MCMQKKNEIKKNKNLDTGANHIQMELVWLYLSSQK